MNSLKSVAMPAQHGGWGFLFEPILASLILAPSWAGFFLAFSGLFLFLLHQPLKTALKDRLRGRRFARTGLAERVALVYAAGAAAAFVAAHLSAEHAFWLPLLIAMPLGIVQFWSDLRSEGRTAVAEIAGALAFAGLASMIVLASGGEIVTAGLVWLLLAARAAPAILYVRARLRLEKGQPADPRVSTAAHAAALIGVLALALTGVVSPLLIVGAGVLLARAALGLSARRKPVTAKVIGFREIAYGALYAVLVGVAV
ncbi:MAG: YwiC-like family protein [Anaerolineae bacterium]|nr:YwiC-like family protein [Anaerolineae bacterium]